MIIVSQDKTQIFNFDNINYLQMGKNLDNDFAVEINYSGCNYNVIARYKTEERAKEVLQEIVNKYRQFNLDNNKTVTLTPKVYEMPKE